MSGFQSPLGCGADHSRGRGWICAACWRAWWVDRQIRRRLKADGGASPSPDLDARILAAMGFPPETVDSAGRRPHDRHPTAKVRASRWHKTTATLARQRVPMAAAALVLLGVLGQMLTVKRPAPTVERVLATMARVETARWMGWRIDYPGTAKATSSPEGVRSPVELWYRAPMANPREIEASLPDPPPRNGILLLDHLSPVLWGEGMGPVFDGPTLLPLLRPDSLFSPEGTLGRAFQDKGAQVRVPPAPDESGAQTVTLDSQLLRRHVRWRLRWVLSVDPRSDRLVRAEWSATAWDGSAWRLAERGALDHFEYNVPVPEGPSGVQNHVRFVADSEQTPANHRRPDQR